VLPLGQHPYQEESHGHQACRHHGESQQDMVPTRLPLGGRRVMEVGHGWWCGIAQRVTAHGPPGGGVAAPGHGLPAAEAGVASG